MILNVIKYADSNIKSVELRKNRRGNGQRVKDVKKMFDKNIQSGCQYVGFSNILTYTHTKYMQGDSYRICYFPIKISTFFIYNILCFFLYMHMVLTVVR